jgi:glutaredoxin
MRVSTCGLLFNAFYLTGFLMKNKVKIALVHTVLVALTASAAIAIGRQVPILVDQYRGNVKSGDYAAHFANQPQRLTLYGTTTCSHCIAARKYLTQAGIAFNDRIIDTSADSRAMFARLNEDGVPVLVSRTSLISGFNQEAYDELARASALN